MPPRLCSSRYSSGVYISHISINSLSNVVCNMFYENATKSHYMNELVFPRLSLVNIEAYICLWVPRCWLCEDSTKIVGCDARLCCFLHHLAIKLSPATWCCVFSGGGFRKMEVDFLCQFVFEWPYGTVLPYFFLDNIWYQKCKMETEKNPLEKQGECFWKSWFRSSHVRFPGLYVLYLTVC